MSDFNLNVIKVNLLGLVGGAVFWGIIASFTDGSGLLFFGFQIMLQALANAALGLVNLLGNTGQAAGYWLSALLVLIIGTGSCGLLGSIVT